MLTKVVIHPFGKIKGELVKAIKSAIEHSFGVKVVIGRSVAIPARHLSLAAQQSQMALEKPVLVIWTRPG